jgi:hypothetical protein
VGARPVVVVDSRLVSSAADRASPEYKRVGRGAFRGFLGVLRVKEGSLGRTWWRCAIFAMHVVACMAADACIVILYSNSLQLYM